MPTNVKPQSVTPVLQTAPDGSFPACLASIFCQNPRGIPNFEIVYKSNWISAFFRWVSKHGYKVVTTVGVEDEKPANSLNLYIQRWKLPDGSIHSTVNSEGRVVWDPSPTLRYKTPGAKPHGVIYFFAR